MRLIDFLDKGASLGPDRPCLTMDGRALTYGEVQRLTYRVARALKKARVEPGAKVAVLSGNDPVAFAFVFGISRAGAVWCPINPRNEAAENRHILDAFDCTCLLFASSFAPLIERILPSLPKLSVLICLDAGLPYAPALDDWLPAADDAPLFVQPVDDVAMIAGTGGTTGVPKGVMLSGHNLETMSAITLIAYPFTTRPVYLALAPLTHAAGVLCLPIMTLGGSIIILPKADLALFLDAIERFGITHTFLPPTLVYMLLEHPRLTATDLRSLQCFWYGAAPMSTVRLREALERIGPVMAQLFGQTEAPMMLSTLAPAEHFHADGSVAVDRLASAGRAAPLVQLAIMDDAGMLLATGAHGEIVVRSPLVMLGYYNDPEATAEVSRHGWHHTGDIGYLDEDNYLFIVDRAKDMIITGGFNVYSVEVERALLEHPCVQDSAVVGLPDKKWGERIAAVLQLYTGRTAEPQEIIAFVKERIGSVKTPKSIDIWSDLPRSKVGKVIKREIRNRLLADVDVIDD